MARKRQLKIECDSTAGIDRNLRNVTVGNELHQESYDLSEIVKIPLMGYDFPPSAPHLLTGSQLHLAGLFPLGGIAQAWCGPVLPEICMR